MLCQYVDEFVVVFGNQEADVEEMGILGRGKGARRK